MMHRCLPRGPARGAPAEPEPSPRRARAGAKQRRAERDWRRVQSGSPSKRGADVRPGCALRGLAAPPADSCACRCGFRFPATQARPSPTPAPTPESPNVGPDPTRLCTELASTFSSEQTHCPRLLLSQRSQRQGPKDTRPLNPWIPSTEAPPIVHSYLSPRRAHHLPIAGGWVFGNASF